MAAKKPAKRKVGRPSTYDPAYCDIVVALGAEGKSLCQISAHPDVNVARTTLISWGQRHEEFSTALARAKELEQAWWEERAQENLGNREFNAPLWHKNVASRFRSEYGEKVAVEASGPNGGPIQTEDVSLTESARRVAFLLAQGLKAAS